MSDSKENEESTEKYDSVPDTLNHIRRVQELLSKMADSLIQRGIVHDTSKLEDPEKSVFDEMTPKLKGSTYGSDEYKGFLEEMKVGLDHHYAHNSHHPEHYDIWECIMGCGKTFDRSNVPAVGYPSPEQYRWCDVCHPDGYPGYFETTLKKHSGIPRMSLMDIIEMLADWKAATERHADGDISKSIEINKERFGMSDQLAEILKNTVSEMNWFSENKNDGDK